MKKVLVAYFSHYGTTRKIAEEIHQEIGGDLFEIKEAVHYPRDYNAVLKQAKQEIDSGFKPQLTGNIPEVKDCHLIIIGSPNWWGTIAPPVAAFLAQADFSGRIIAPFITHGGGGLNRTVNAIRQLCPDANVLDGLDANRHERLSAWLKSLL